MLDLTHDERLLTMDDYISSSSCWLGSLQYKFNLAKCKFGGSMKSWAINFPIGGRQRSAKFNQDRKSGSNIAGCTDIHHRFVKKYSHKTTALCELLNKDVDFHWEAEHHRALDSLKSCFIPKKSSFAIF